MQNGYESKEKPQSPLKILMLTGHVYSSKRKAGFHHLAKALMDENHEVTFCTVPNSVLEVGDSILDVVLSSKDAYIVERRMASFFQAAFPKKQGKLIETSYISLATNIQKSKSKLNFLYRFNNIVNIDKLLKEIFMHGYCKSFSEKYDVIIFESTNGLLLFDYLRIKNPNARLIYRVSDDLEVVNGIQEVIQYEEKILPKFDLISSPSSQIASKLKLKSPSARIITQYHGIEKSLFDKDYPNPYSGSCKNFVFVGSGFMDEEFLKIASEINQNWTFHIIGNLPRPIKSDNIIYYGEISFSETIPYLKHADCGLQILAYTKGIEAFEKSLKYIQYTYLRLPIIAPKYMKLKHKHTFLYEPTKASIENAILKALEYNRSLIHTNDILSWSEISKDIILSTLNNEPISKPRS